MLHLLQWSGLSSYINASRILKHYAKKKKKSYQKMTTNTNKENSYEIHEACSFPSIMALCRALAGLLPWASVTRSCLSHRFCQQDFLCCEPGAEGHGGPQCTNGVNFLPVPTNPCPVPSTRQDTCFPHTGREKTTKPFLNKNCDDGESIVWRLSYQWTLCQIKYHYFKKQTIKIQQEFQVSSWRPFLWSRQPSHSCHQCYFTI